jgi:2-iminobutanoate/2-iminopropanoate deaminase
MSGNLMSRCMRIGIAAAFALAAFDVAAATQTEFYERPAPTGGTKLPFSEAVRAGDMLYLAGELGVDASGKLAAGGIKAETKQMMDNIGATLARHGSSFDRTVTCTVALADISEWAAFNEIYRGYFKDHFPARMAYAASGLALNARVEMQCVAVVGK